MEFVSNFLLFLHKHLTFLDGWSILDNATMIHLALFLWFMSVIRYSPFPITNEPPRGGFFKRVLQLVALLHLGMNCMVVYLLVTAFHGHNLGEAFSAPVMKKMATANEYFVWLQIIGLVEMLLHLARGCDNAGNSLWFRMSLYYFKFVTAWNVAKSTPPGGDWLASAMQLEDCVLYLLLCLSLFVGYWIRGRTESRDEETVQQLCVPYKTYLTELAFFQAVAEVFRVRMIGLNETSTKVMGYLIVPLLMTLCLFLKRMKSLHVMAIRDFGGVNVETKQHMHED